MTACPCHSQKQYTTCCGPYHAGKRAENALILMRSRYSAYALQKAAYIAETTHPKSPTFPHDLAAVKQFGKLTQFIGLQIVAFEEQSDTATVTFRALLRQHNRDASFTEQSFFEKTEGRWLYCRGDILS